MQSVPKQHKYEQHSSFMQVLPDELMYLSLASSFSASLSSCRCRWLFSLASLVASRCSTSTCVTEAS